MHHWDDDKLDWAGINGACDILYSTSRRWGRLGGQVKEKFGTVRFYASFGHLSLHTLIYPGYVYSQFPKWLWRLDIYITGPILDKLFGRLFVWWQTKVYRYAYKKALKAYPHLREEILCAADYRELLEGL
jgi:hypothetical protein